MRKTIIIAVLALTLIMAGCLVKSEKWGCCIRENATKDNKCFLYNTTDFKNYTSLMGLQTECNETVLNCLIHLTDERNITLPICTGSELVSCVSPDCTAMVCGSFAFKPRAAPGYSDMNDTSTPALDTTGDAVQFYKAQCRFLPMDAKLNNIMKNSKSQINVFRLGVGASFDEYDQYKNFLPMADKFCNINPSGSSSARVDRYMNYLAGDNAGGVAPYDDPVNGITDNCVDDANPPAPFKFGEASAGTTTTSVPGVGFISWTRKIPDVSNYKTANQFRWDLAAVWQTDFGGYFSYSDPVDIPSQADRMYKKIDDAFYRKYLSIAHADDIYDTAHKGKSRAPFECDISSNECYSGSCDTTTYMRGTLVEATDSDKKKEIVADCVKDIDENSVTKVICNPTTGVTVHDAVTPPTITDAYVNLVPALLVGDYDPNGNSLNPDVTYDQLNDQNNNMFDSAYTSFPVNAMGAAWLAQTPSGDGWQGWVTGATRTMTSGASDISFYWSQSKYCPVDHPGASGTASENDTVWCSHVSEDAANPPIGGAVFFGKTGNEQVNYGGSDIIGYALARPEDFPNLYVVKNCEMTSNDYIKVDIGTPNTWGTLITAFKPYYDNHMKELMGTGWQDDGCGGAVDLMDGAFTSMPWVVDFEKGARLIRDVPVYGPDDYSTARSAEKDYVFHLSSQPAQYARTRNIYDVPMSGLAGSSSCELRRTWFMNSWSDIGRGFLTDRSYQGYYNILYSSNIYLFKFDPATKKLGKCAIDDNSYMPKVTTLGWCRPCTTSTLAYQKITTQQRVYLPVLTADVEGASAKDIAGLCSANYDTNWGWEGIFPSPQVTDNVSCFNRYVSDLQDYKDSIGWYGSPKTIPEATIIKERTGNYLKSGVMPVFDMSDASNWNRDNPDCTPTDDGGCEGKSILWWHTDLFGPQRYFLQYDFQRLFANMGASVVIIDHVRDTDVVTDPRTVNYWGMDFPLPPLIDEVRARAEIVRDFCPYCLIAVHVDNPTTPDSFSQIINDTIVDPSVSVDLFTFDYDISRHNYQVQKAGTANASLVAEDIERYGRAGLNATKGGRPTMIVGLNVESDDGYWNDGNYKELFDTIVYKQDKLIKSGIVGMIYMPVRTYNPGGEITDPRGVVFTTQPNDQGIGSKGQKFCALQEAMFKMTTTPPNALITKTVVANTMNCTSCSSLEITLGNCGLPDPNPLGHTAPVCDDGIECNLNGLNPATSKCPDNTVVAKCPLCKDIPGTFNCTYFYGNGTTTPYSEPMSVLASDMYTDVIAGFDKPDKCCLTDPATNINYTYMKQSISSPVNKPVVFSKAGDPKIDCGFGTSIEDTATLSSFCGAEAIPFKDYDIKCCVNCAAPK